VHAQKEVVKTAVNAFRSSKFGLLLQVGVTEILGGTKIRKLGGQSLKLLPPDVIF